MSTAIAHRASIALLPLTLALAGCGDSVGSGSAPAAAATPAGFFEALDQARVGKPQVAWQSLPASYRTDVDALIDDFSGRMDAKLWDDGFAVLGKLVRVLDEKREYILGFPMVQMFTSQSDKKAVDTQYGAVVKTLSAVVNSDIKTLDGLKDLDVAEFLTKTVGSTMGDLLGAANTMGASGLGGPDAAMLSAKLEAAVVSETGDGAVVALTKPDGSKEQVSMSKVEGVWVPKDMADGWKQGIADAKSSLAELKITDEDRAQAAMMFGMANGFLDGLLKASSQEEFDEAIDGMSEMFGAFGG